MHCDGERADSSVSQRLTGRPFDPSRDREGAVSAEAQTAS
jgi:hypothetical protein